MKYSILLLSLSGVIFAQVGHASEELSVKESKRRLGIFADRLDKNEDGKMDYEELKEKIEEVHKRNIEQDVKNQMEIVDTNKDGILEWDEFYIAEYVRSSEADMKEDEQLGFNYKKMIRRDMKRWKSADVDGNDKLSHVEIMSFFHPEEYEHMKDIVIMETIEDIDKNGDGFIDEKEYLGDSYYPTKDTNEPGWVTSEKRQFSKFRDRNGDGKLDKEEVKSWILPDEYDEVGEAASSLIYQADSNRDEYLTKDEIVEHHAAFIGSQITNRGRDLERHEDF